MEELVLLYLTDGKDFDYIWDATVLEQEYLAIPAGTKNEAEARKFVAYAATAESLSRCNKTYNICTHEKICT